MNVFRTSTWSGPGSGRVVSTVRKLSGVGQPCGREARWISRAVVIPRSCQSLPNHPGSGLEGERELDLSAGVDRGVEAVGYQAHDSTGTEHPELVLDNLVNSVRTTGGIGVVGVYMPSDPGAATDSAKEGRIGFQYGTFFTKGQSMGTGQAPVKRYNRQLRDLIITGQATPSFIVSHEIPLADAVDAYDKFDRRVDGYTKVLLKPQQ